MWTTFGQRIGQTARSLLPLGSILLFILVTNLAWPVPFIGSVTPSLGLMGVFYWAIYRPDLLRPLSVFLLGLISDAVSGFPLGLTACAYLLVYQAAFAQRRYFVSQFFSVLWVVFALFSFLASVLFWIVLSLRISQPLSLLPVFAQWLATVFFFPMPAWILNRLQRLFLTQS